MRMNASSAAMLAALTFAGCGGSSSSTPAVPAASSQRAYNGTASVGDFLTLTVNPSAHTIAYVNRSNGDSGTVSYTVNADGTYAINDPTGNLVTAYEIPNYAMVIQANNTGADHHTASLVTAVQSGPISMSTWAGHTYNYMQFRTTAGGVEVGAVSIAPTSISGQAYWPYGSMNGSSQFLTIPNVLASTPAEDSSGTFLTVTERGGGGSDYIFGTANGQFMVDTTNGAILGFQQAARKDFDPSVAGTYKALYYQKTSATTGIGNVETGTASLVNATISIDAAGHVSITDSHGASVVSSAQLVPVADASYLVGAGELADPCFGMFTFRVTTGSSQEDVFMTFQGRAVLFSSFKQPVPASGSSSYDYFYGVALH